MTSEVGGEPLLRVEHLIKHFPLRRGLFGRANGSVQAVDGVSFTLAVGETLALVGESGFGKSTTGRLVLRLLKPTSRRVWFDGEDLTALPEAAIRRHRRSLQIIFQDPFASLNPRMTVGQTLEEPLALHGLAEGRKRELVAEVLGLVGLTAKNYIEQAPWMAIWPGLSIFVLVLSFNLLGDGLRDALDPRHG